MQKNAHNKNISVWTQLWRVFQSAFNAFNTNRAGTQGAALSFFMVFALPPVLVLLVLFASLFADNAQVQQWLLVQARHSSGQLGVEIVKLILTHASQPDATHFFAAMVSFLMLIFAATGIFTQLQDTLNTIWGVMVRPEVSIQRMMIARLVSFCLILAVGVMLLLTMLLDLGLAVVEKLLTPYFEILEQVHFFQHLSLGISFVVLTLLFASVFKFLPDVYLRWRELLTGAVFTSMLLTLSKFLIGWFLSAVDLGTAYGTMGSLIVFLFWMHLNIQIFLFGAELTEALACENGAPIRPASYAIWLPGRVPTPDSLPFVPQ